MLKKPNKFGNKFQSSRIVGILPVKREVSLYTWLATDNFMLDNDSMLDNDVVRSTLFLPMIKRVDIMSTFLFELFDSVGRNDAI